MAMTIPLNETSPLYKKLLKRIQARLRLAEREHANQYDKWQRAEELTLAYLPEQELDGERRRKRERGTPTYTTIQVPYAYAVLMTAHTYWTSVFFARTPVHQYSGRHGEGEQQVQALEALIAYQVEVGEMMGPYYIWLYDAAKYGHGILGTYWADEIISYGSIGRVETSPGVFEIMQTNMELPGYKGNRVYNVSPYDFMHDPRVPLHRFQDGEFCAARCRLGWDRIIERKLQGYYVNTDKLKEHVGTDKSSTNGSSMLGRPNFAKTYWDDETEESKHPAGSVLWEVYVKLIPSEWDLGTSNYPQKWCFTITEDLDLLIGASPLGLIHGKFPFDVLEAEIEGYGLYSRGIPEIIEPIQNTMDWLLNTHFYNVRASLNNQFLVDPSKLVIKDTKKSGPGFVWRLRPEAYGSDLRAMFMQIPVSDVTRGNIADLQEMLRLGERTLGINEQIMGALSGTQRKTATEVRQSTGFGVNRLKTVTEYMSAVGFAPHSQKLVQNSQQLYDASAKLRRVGDLAMDAGMGFLDVGPDDISGFFDFVPVDGTLPVDRMAQANLWKEILMGLTRMPPQIAMQYDVGKIFAWTAQLSGLKNINQFKVQVLPPGVAPSAGAIPLGGNVVPGPGRGVATPGNSASTAAGLNALGATE